jgi:hypothetical protein
MRERCVAQTRLLAVLNPRSGLRVYERNQQRRLQPADAR